MTTHRPFREIVPSGTNLEFIGKTRTWVIVSILLVAGSIAMLFVNKSMRGDYLNWTIDFKGGTEIIMDFKKSGTDEFTPVSSGDARDALKAAGFKSFDVSEFTYEISQDDGSVADIQGILVRTKDFGAMDKARAADVAAKFVNHFKGEAELRASWAGDQLFVRGTKLVEEEEAAAFFKAESLEMKPWGPTAGSFRTPNEGTGEYSAQYVVWGIDRQFRDALTAGLEGIDAHVLQVYGVGSKAGGKLRNDGIKSLFFAILLIMLYLAVRFDVRYAPGAVVALLHDALLVVGVFAVTWQEVSLTSIAALLTIIGYSVNDTVVIFDRIRENVTRLKDKKFARVINISLNETLARTLLTSLTLFVVTLMMNIFGTGLVRNFAFAMNIGVIVGVYSSVFVASPVALYLHNRYFAAK
jgi:preprotein translocase subunit SecF